MTFKMINDKRNRDNIAKLAPATKAATLKLYDYCIKNKINILIYETIRTVEQQKKNVREGKSKTMKSYHLVGQALDWVLVDNKSNALWNGYNTPSAQQVIKYANSIGFVSGHDWGWDSPHLQYEHRGYGTDVAGKTAPKAATTATPKATTAKTLKVGAKVMVKSGVKDYSGKSLAPQVYKTLYSVISVSGNRAVIGIGKVVTAAVHKDHLIVQ